MSSIVELTTITEFTTGPARISGSIMMFMFGTWELDEDQASTSTSRVEIVRGYASVYVCEAYIRRYVFACACVYKYVCVEIT